MADGVRAVQEMVNSGLIKKNFHELREDANLLDISINRNYIKKNKASADAEKEGS